MRKSIVSIFGSSRVPSEDSEYEQARRLGCLVAKAGMTVCTGGYGGAMEAASLGAREAGGKTIGVTCSLFEDERRGHNPYVDEVIHTENLHDRMRKIIELGDFHVAMPGGPGTLAEIGHTWNLLQCGCLKNGHPLILLGGKWRELEPILRTNRWVKTKHMDLLRFVDTPEEAFEAIENEIRKDR